MSRVIKSFWILTVAPIAVVAVVVGVVAAVVSAMFKALFLIWSR